MDAPEGADRAGGACDDGHDLDEAALGWVLRLTSGEATDAEAEALRDEGIEIARIPWVPRSDG